VEEDALQPVSTPAHRASAAGAEDSLFGRRFCVVGGCD